MKARFQAKIPSKKASCTAIVPRHSQKPINKGEMIILFQQLSPQMPTSLNHRAYRKPFVAVVAVPVRVAGIEVEVVGVFKFDGFCEDDSNMKILTFVER